MRFEQRMHEFPDEVERTMNEAALQGLSRSGALIQTIQALCGQEARNRVHVAWQELKNVLAAAGVSYSDTLATDLKAEVERYAGVADLRETLKRKAESAGFESPSIEAARDLALREVSSDIDLYVISLKQYVEQTSHRSDIAQPVLNFLGPVAAVQTGAGATATIVQNISQGDREALLAALNLVEHALQTVEQVAGHPKEEVLELVRDGRTEVEKPKPNLFRVDGIAMGIATAIQTAPNLQPAYQSLKATLAAIGIQLPW